MATFKSLVRNDKLSQPVHNSFKIGKWRKAWQESGEPTEDLMFFQAGEHTAELLSDIRARLSKVLYNMPHISADELAKALAGISTRDRALVREQGVSELLESQESIYSYTSTKNVMNNPLQLQEAAEAAVSGLSKAMITAIKHKTNTNSKSAENSKQAKLNLTKSLYFLSQVYDATVDYWSCVLWRDFEFRFAKKNDHKICLYSQPKTADEIAFESSSNRRDRLLSQAGGFLHTSNMHSYFMEDQCIYPKKHKGKWHIKRKSLKHLRESTWYSYTVCQYYRSLLEDYFPSVLIKSETKHGYSIDNLLVIWVQLSIYCSEALDTSIENGIPNDYKTTLSLNPTVNCAELCRELSLSTNIDLKVVERVISALTFNEESNFDLWETPLVRLQDNDILMVVGAVIDPNIVRICETWATLLDMDVSAKGPEFEKHTFSRIDEALSNCTLPIAYQNPEINIILHAEGDSEEVDLAFMVGSTVYLCEAKCIFSPDKSSRYLRTKQILKDATKQITRKAAFFRSNIVECFKQLNWPFDAQANYDVFPIVINSNFAYVGYMFDEVPILDIGILCDYFNKPIAPIITDPQNGYEHLAWFVLYDDVTGLYSNLKEYLKRPPHIIRNKGDFVYRQTTMPQVGEKSTLAMLANLIPKQKSVIEFTEVESAFKVECVPDITQKLEELGDGYL